MNRIHTIALRFLIVSVILCACFTAGSLAQAPLQPAPQLPAGMTGSDTSDPRAKLTPGMYNAGETAMGIRHLMLLKKPDAFQLGTDNPDDPKVQKTLGLLGVGDSSKIP